MSLLPSVELRLCVLQSSPIKVSCGCGISYGYNDMVAVEQDCIHRAVGRAELTTNRRTGILDIRGSKPVPVVITICLHIPLFFLSFAKDNDPLSSLDPVRNIMKEQRRRCSMACRHTYCHVLQAAGTGIFPPKLRNTRRISQMTPSTRQTDTN